MCDVLTLIKTSIISNDQAELQ